MNVYKTQLRLRNKDVNLHRRLRTSVLFELMQEASIRHTEQLDMGREMTLDRGLLWVVTLQQAEIARMPEYDETITLESWPGKTLHLLFPRYYRILDEKGSPLICASSLWALMDENTRHMVFPDRHGIVIEGESTGNELALPSTPRRAAGESRDFTVPFSYVDLNGHMNNTRYFDLAEDWIPAAAEGRSLRKIAIEYSAEARLGETVRVSTEREGETWYISGDAEKRVFRMALTYEKTAD